MDMKEIKDLFDGEEVEKIESDSTILEVGQAVRGTYKGIEQRTDNEGESRDIAILQTEEGEQVAIPCGSTLTRKLEKVQEGTEIGILRTEDGVSKSGRTFKNFKVFRKSK